MTDDFVVGGWLRRLTGLALLAAGLIMVVVGWGLDWGVAVTTVLPGLVLLVPALGLLRGACWRRAAAAAAIENCGQTVSCSLQGAQVEILPTAGLRAVVLHPAEGHPVTLAAWLLPRRAEALAAWLDHHAGCELPRIAHEKHRLDQ